MASAYSRSNGGGALPAAASPGGGPMSRKSRNRCSSSSSSSSRGPANANATATANANSRSSRTRRRTGRHRNNNTNEESPLEFIGAAFLITSAIVALFYYCGVGLGSWLNNYSGNTDYDSASLAIDSTSLGKIDDDESSHSRRYRNNNSNLNNLNNAAAAAAASTRRKEWAQQGLPILPQKGIYQPPLLSPHTSSIDTVLQYLTQLAEQPPSQLWNMFGMDQQSDNDNTDTNNYYGEDPFSLKQLEHGKCPIIPLSSSSSTTFTIPWLPSKPYNSEEIAAKYKRNMEALLFQHQQQNNEQSGGNSGGLGESIRKNKQKRGMKRVEPMETYNVEKEVAIWYEHLSKAGGSTFCGLANANSE